MGVSDYKARRIKVKGIIDENEATWKQLGNRIDASAKRAREIADALGYGLEDFDKHWTANDEHMEAWYGLADRIIALQAEQKAATKARDKARAKELEKEIAKLDKEAQGIEKKAQKTLREANALKNTLIEASTKLEAVEV